VLESGDAEFVEQIMDSVRRKASLIQKTKQRKLNILMAALVSLSLVLSGKESHGVMVIVVLFYWFWTLRLDSNIKLLKLAEKIQSHESTLGSKMEQDQGLC
jgi:hypothetical protein